MIYELKNNQFHRISHLLKGEFINIEIKAVVEGYNPGWVFVDNIESPKTSMIWSRGIEGFYFVGDASNGRFNNSIYSYIREEIVPRAEKLGLRDFEFSGTSREWDKNFGKIFNEEKLNKSKQFVYKNKKIDNYSLSLQDDYILKEVNKDLLHNESFNLDFVKSAIYEWWDLIDDFIKYGIGFCILHNEVAVCSCVTSFMTDSSMESHIKTMEKYRKKGLATRAVGEYVKYCKENQYTPYWDCMEKNYGSRALAKKFGYKKEFDYILYSFKF